MSVSVNDFNHGDRVRVIIEGTVKKNSTNPFADMFKNTLVVDMDDDKGEILLPEIKITRVEEMPPVFEEGKAYEDADGDVFIRTATAWLGADADRWLDDEVSHPMRLLTAASA